MAAETTPLIGGSSYPQRQPHGLFERRHYGLLLVFCFCVGLSVMQLFLQTIVLPPLLTTIPDNLGLLVSIFSSEIVGNITDLAWVLITDGTDRYFHDALFGASLNSKERDALRKVESLDAVLQIGATRILVIAGSLVQASSEAMGLPLAIILCLSLIGLNVCSRWLGGQFGAIEKNWEDVVERNRYFNASNKLEYERTQRELRQSRLRRVCSDKIRAIVWISGLGFAVFAVGGRLPAGIYGKILKDILSLDVYMEKFLKSCVPARTLVHTCREQAIQDECGCPHDVEAVSRALIVGHGRSNGQSNGSSCTATGRPDGIGL